jgi:general secretion pathway protein D
MPAASAAPRPLRSAIKPALALALAAATAIGGAVPAAFAQQAATTRPAGAVPTTQTATTQGGPNAATRPNGSITTQPGGGLLLNFKEASIESVLDELSAAAGFIVIKDVPRLEGRVTLTSKQPVKPDEAVPLLNSVLRNAGYVAVQQGRVLKIMSRDKAEKANIPVRTGSDYTKIAETDELITQVIPLRSADAAQLKQDLTPLVNPDADFTANASSNSLVITDTSANIRRVAQIVAAMDNSIIDAADVKVIQLKYASAGTASKLILEVFGEQATQNQQGGGRGQGRGGGGGGFGGGGFGGGGGGFGGGGFGGGGPGGGGGGRGGGGGGGAAGTAARRLPRVTASSDDRTNTLIVSGPTATLAIIERVVKDLDADPSSEETVFIYRLKNAQSLNVESVMNALFNGTSTGTRGTTTGGLQGARGGTTGGLTRGGGGGGGRGGGGGGLGGGRGTGGGLGGGGFGGGGFGGGGFAGGGFGGGGFRGGVSTGAQRTGADLAGQVTIIADPDTNSLLVRTRPGNYERVKAVLAELDRPVGQVLIKVLVAEVTHDNTTDIGAEFSILNLRASGNGQRGGTNFGLSRLTSGLVVQILESDFSATVRALEQVGKLDVLSRPYILASDNQLASITVGQEIPFITNSRITDTGQTINSVEYDDIGILLDVIPHINSEGLVILDVAPEISALTGTQIPISDTVSSPVIAKRSAQSRVAVKDGQTIVIGGLMEDRKTETISKVPFLGDIPLVGEVFRRRENKKTKTELLIFLTPHVAAQPESLQGMSKEELDGSRLVPRAVDPNAFRDQLEGMQRGRGPGVMPEMPSSTPVRPEVPPPPPARGDAPPPAPLPEPQDD